MCSSDLLVKEFPHIPGIDFSGKVIESENSKFKSGDEVILTGFRVGEVFFGGLGDLSFNDLAYAGYEKAVADFGMKGTFLEPEGGGENRGELLELCAEAGNDLIIGNGFLFDASMNEVAPNYPDLNFAITDGVAEPGNVRGMLFNHAEGSFLAGVAAALKTKTNNVGFLGGVDFPLIHEFEQGFLAGVAAINPDIVVQIGYASVAPDFSGFNDTVKGKEIALAQYEAGADIIYHAAGGTGTGMFQAAKEVSESTGSKVWGIGVDFDQYYQVRAMQFRDQF